MFRQPLARLRHFIPPLAKRGAIRFQSGAEHKFKPEHLQPPFWNSGRVLLFTAITGTTTYFYGAKEEPHRLPLPWLKSTGPQYANKKEMEKVRTGFSILNKGMLNLSGN